jgi:hypothetical protein
MQTDGVQTMTIDTWVALPTLVTLFTGFYGLSRRDSTRLREELRGELGDLRTEMRDEFAALRGELRREVRRLDDKVERLDDRVYGLAGRLQPALDAPPGE